jgi:hypothetical protein
MLEKAIATTRRGQYAHVQYARFADDVVILIDSHPAKWLAVEGGRSVTTWGIGEASSAAINQLSEIRICRTWRTQLLAER